MPNPPTHVIVLKYDLQIMSRIMTTISVGREDPAGPDLIHSEYKRGGTGKYLQGADRTRALDIATHRVQQLLDYPNIFFSAPRVPFLFCPILCRQFEDVL